MKKKKPTLASERSSRRLREFLRDARDARGLSQAALASKLGYESAQYVSDWERGISSPPMKKLAKISDLLEIDMDRFFGLLVDVAKERVVEDLTKDYARVRKANGKRGR
jgi:transcriptional regulator with XRE-family HTH domain